MAVSPTNKQGKTTYYFEVRVNWDKLMAIDQQTESFKAQVFLEATLRYPKKVNPEDEADVLTIFQRATVENSLAKPEDDGHPEPKFKRATENSLAKWEIWEENGRPKLAMRRQDPVRKAPLQFVWLIHGEFGEELELQNFPFDVQDLTVMIRFGWPCKDDRVQVRFIDAGKSEVFLNVFCLKNAWTQPEAVDVQFGFTKTKSEKFPQFPLIRIRCQVGRKPKFYFVNVILPVASIVLASASSLAVSHDMGGRLGATLTLLLTAVAYKYLVAEMVPRISYNTMLDWYVLVCWAFLLAMVLENCFVKGNQPKVCVIFSVLFGVFNVGFAVRARCIYNSERQRLKKVPSPQPLSAGYRKLRKSARSDSESDTEENESDCEDDFNMEDPQDLTLTEEDVKLLEKNNMSPMSSRSTASGYIRN
ncbi:unnamed protein product [Cladocopium goreaui]|uniref:Cys-loop ligand-gated ion channel (ELIC) n=1 Tax=Cladocopium goreaui TaxID=2562237 RepID=A0A9P1CTS7_9DINO|nr:unnamed protein product [Cladocopium goreaui]